jgi:hypothetical protein
MPGDEVRTFELIVRGTVETVSQHSCGNQPIVSAVIPREVRLNVWVLDRARPTSFSRCVFKRGAKQRGENQSQIRPNVNIVYQFGYFQVCSFETVSL